ncbi:MAG: hypothetical protein KJ645_14800 [Planctomycetes bacterium]|nr:hypothetical protein [Planctomycetota bacterium]
MERRRDAGESLAGVRRVVEEGILEVHAYCLMGTHFHMLVPSHRAKLSRATMFVQKPLCTPVQSGASTGWPSLAESISLQGRSIGGVSKRPGELYRSQPR